MSTDAVHACSHAPVIRVHVERFRCFDEVTVVELKKVNLVVGSNNVGKTALLTALRRLTRIDDKFVRRIAPRGGVGVWGTASFLAFKPGDWCSKERPHVSLVLSSAASGEHEVTANCVAREEPGERLKALAARIVYIPSRRIAPHTLQRADPTEHEERRYDGHDLLVDLVEAAAKNEPEVRQRVEAFMARVLGCAIQLGLSVDPPGLSIQLGADPMRPLDAVGEGITQLLAIAGAVASVDCPILLLEEPETALHPLLQRRLIDALLGTSDLQCFVATHSNHILDVVDENVSVYRLHIEGGRRQLDRLGPDDIHCLADLGVRPSSIAAANCVIWVEGPSDAIFLEAWLTIRAPDLRRWSDYTFAFLGGALLAHASPDDETLLRLLRVHPSFFVVADSDRNDSTQPLGKPYFQRLVEVMPASRIWITEGREIESYVSDATMCAALGASTGGHQAGVVSDPGMKLGARLEKLQLPTSHTKVERARRIVDVWRKAPDWPLGLCRRVDELAAFTRARSETVPALVRRTSAPLPRLAADRESMRDRIEESHPIATAGAEGAAEGVDGG